nr:class II fructose-bisphosphatase [Geomicrobium halophilum]
MSYLPVTQNAAISVESYIGNEDKILIDGQATEAMRTTLQQLEMKSTVVIGEGEMDEAPMLYIGETLGKVGYPEFDLAVDPIDGTTLAANGQNQAISVLAGGTKGSLLHAPDMYMEKIAVGSKAAGHIDLTDSLEVNLKRVAFALEKPLTELNVLIQDRKRHESIVKTVRSIGPNVKQFTDVDITAIVATCLEDYDADIFIGIGGAPEGVIGAVAARTLGGDFQGRLKPKSDNEYNRCMQMGMKNPEKHLFLEDIIKTDDCFFIATGVTNGDLLKGIQRKTDGTVETETFISHDFSNQFLTTVHESRG